MGWTGMRADYYKNGKVDVKRQLDEQFTWGGNHTVIKSAMVGTIYYAAVLVTTGEKPEVIAIVSATSTKQQDGCNFFYNAWSEDSGPIFWDCPISILKLLTPIESQWANEWRQKCLANIEKKKAMKKDPNSLKNLPKGSKIRFIAKYNMIDGTKAGDIVVLTKMSRKGYRLNPDTSQYELVDIKVYWSDGCYRWKDKCIPEDYTILCRGEKAA